MAPTVKGSNIPSRDRRPIEKRPELLSRVKYCNTLPDIPFDVKFISNPFDPSRFVQYRSTTLESSYKHEIITENDLGVNIELINRDIYAFDPNAELDPADEKLLEDEVYVPRDSARSRHHARSVSWLRRTEYISTEQTRFQPQVMENVEAKVGFTLKKNFRSEILLKDRDSQIKAIDKIFEDIKVPIVKHHRNPLLEPVEIIPVFPDFDMWKHEFAHVIFETEARATKGSSSAELEVMSQAMIRGVQDESGMQFVAYFTPLEETMEKRKRDFADGVDYVDDDEYEYKMTKEYNWTVSGKGEKGSDDTCFFIMKNDGVYYGDFDKMVRLRNRRTGQQMSNTHLIVKHRPLNAAEHKAQRRREKQLEPPNDDEDEDDDDEDQQQEEDQNDDDDENGDEDQEQEQNDDADGNESERSKGSRASRSRSRSKASSRSRSPSKSSSRSRSRSKSASPARSESRSVSSKSRSSSPAGSRSRSASPARSRSQSRSRSRSASGSGESSASGSESD